VNRANIVYSTFLVSFQPRRCWWNHQGVIVKCDAWATNFPLENIRIWGDSWRTQTISAISYFKSHVWCTSTKYISCRFSSWIIWLTLLHALLLILHVVECLYTKKSDFNAISSWNWLSDMRTFMVLSYYEFSPSLLLYFL
jgi:hypothetical protein